MSYVQLHEEFVRNGIGPLLWAEIQQVTGRIARTYRTDEYNDDKPWNDETVTVIASETAEALLANGRDQLRYVFDATDTSTGDRLDTLQALLATKVKHTLRDRRRRTPVDRLFTRVRNLTGQAPYSMMKTGRDVTIVATAPPEHAHQLTESEIRRGVALIDSIPRINSRANAQRESKIYSKANLEELVRRLLTAFDPMLLSDIRKILENLLTAWVPTLLESTEEVHAPALSPESELARTQMHSQIDNFAATLDPVHRLVLIGKSQAISDSDLAALAGMSRPTLIKRREAVFARVEEELFNDLPAELHDEATRDLLTACGESEENQE